MREGIYTLADGDRVLIRPVIPTDRAGLRQGVREMSRSSRYMRFLAGMNEMSESLLDYFTIVDQQSHVAWCAVEPLAGKRGYGICRYRLNDSADSLGKAPDLSSDVAHGASASSRLTADFAVAVIDDMQGKGLGTLLLAVIYTLARAQGVQELCGEILPENPVMPQWMQRLGGRLDWDDGQKLYLAHWPVVPVEQLPRDSSTGQRFVQWMEMLDKPGAS